MESGETAGVADENGQNEDQTVDDQEIQQTSGDRQEVTEPPSNSSPRSTKNSPSTSVAEPQEKTSRLRIIANPDSWKSPNAFMNFLTDFRESFRGNADTIKSSELVRLAGEHWRQMSEELKRPYIEAAKQIRSDNSKSLEPSTSKRKRKVQLKKQRGKVVKKPKVVKPISDSEESDSEDSTKTMDSDDESVDTNAS